MNNQTKAKIYNVISAAFIVALIVSLIAVIVLTMNGSFNNGGGDIMMFIVPMQVLFGAIALIFRSKSKEVLLPANQQTVKPTKNPLVMVVIGIIIAVLIIGLLAIIISAISR